MLGPDDAITSMLQSVSEQSIEAVKAAVAKGVRLDSPIYNGGTALHLAAAQGSSAEFVRELVSIGAPVNAKDSSGQTALHMAAARGHLDVATELVDAGADVNMIDTAGRSPVRLANSQDFHQVGKALSAKGGKDIGPLTRAEKLERYGEDWGGWEVVGGSAAGGASRSGHGSRSQGERGVSSKKTDIATREPVGTAKPSVR